MNREEIRDTIAELLVSGSGGVTCVTRDTARLSVILALLAIGDHGPRTKCAMAVEAALIIQSSDTVVSIEEFARNLESKE